VKQVASRAYLYLFGLFFNPENGIHNFLRMVGWLSMDYATLCPEGISNSIKAVHSDSGFATAFNRRHKAARLSDGSHDVLVGLKLTWYYRKWRVKKKSLPQFFSSVSRIMKQRVFSLVAVIPGGRVCPFHVQRLFLQYHHQHNCRVQSYITTDDQSRNKAPIWGLRPVLYYRQTVAGLLTWRTSSHKRPGLSRTIAAGLRQQNHFRV
jgi:hypothetical protein